VSNGHVENPQVSAPGQLDLSNADEILEHVVNDSMNEAEEAMALFEFVKRTVRKWALPNQEGNGKPMQILNVYGYCNCGGFGRTLAMLASLAGLRARVVGLPGHCLTELFYDEAWHAFDANLKTVYPKPDGLLASVEEIQRNPTLLDEADNEFHAPDNFNLDRLRSMYADGQVSYLPPLKREVLHRMSFRLHPEETVEWYRDERAAFFPYQNEVFMCPPPPGYWAGGRLSYCPRLSEATFAKRWGLGSREDDLVCEGGVLSLSRCGQVQKLRMNWDFPWAVLGGRVKIAGFRTPGDGQLRACLNRPERTIHFDGILTEREDRQDEFQAVLDFTRAAILPPPAQVLFGVDLELTMYRVRAESRFLLREVTVEIELQRSPQSLPPSELGEPWLYTDHSPEREVEVAIETE